MNSVRIFVVEGELGDAHFVQDALCELEETTHGGAWLHCEVTHFDHLGDALVVLEAQPPDLVLFNPKLPDSMGLETFVRLRDACGAIPLIALLEECDQGLGRRMLREGAQDYLLKRDIDCGPLARAIMNAIERERFLKAALRHIQTDLQTGLPNGVAFADMAERDRLLARNCGRSLSLLLAELDGMSVYDEACGRTAMHETVVEAANALRSAAGETDLVAHLGFGRFAVLDWTGAPDRFIGKVQSRLAADQSAFAFLFGCARVDTDAADGIAAACGDAEESLCENKLAYSDLT